MQTAGERLHHFEVTGGGRASQSQSSPSEVQNRETKEHKNSARVLCSCMLWPHLINSQSKQTEELS